MAKDFSVGLKNHFQQKVATQQEDNISRLERQNRELQEKLREYESKKDVTGTQAVNINQIILESNIRDNLDYEEIESLAESIKDVGQLQPVLLTKDYHLVAGYRRYNAVKLLGKDGPGFLYALKLDQLYSEINSDLFLKIQYTENDKRKSLDSFHLSNLFHKYLENGKTQKEISEIFGLSKGYISSILNIRNMLPELKQFIKEFQIYAWSKKKFTQVNSEEEISQNRFYQINKGVVGWNFLYKIAKNENPEEQKKAFLKMFKNRLADEELNSNVFKETSKLLLKNENKISVARKYFKNFSDSISEIKENLSEEELKNAEKYLTKIGKIIFKNSEKIK